ncbi:Fe-S cluster assembly ATPase SufC [Lactobacillus sp. CBA3606]|uniref:Fe-S cluster assembly ATPase SufC n=1 Tax=Lactobacillus sp. CBA3606 TaxID=2099789 RepID=UPI000CFB35A9|nr:Fe-S cluster assembly ATPase SufC [Lactobacillus sp. CBA3606]AVK63706.1 Fe-S cluster assembly ATPase SufC [Lactobacillus sp. CBA3606]
MSTLVIKDLKVTVTENDQERLILTGVNLTMTTGETHAIMGPNGTGKSTLAATIMGDPAYHVVSGQVQLDGQDLLTQTVDQRARAGLFLAMQYPAAIKGITNMAFLQAAINARRPKNQPLAVTAFLAQLESNLALLNMPSAMAERYLNAGFSGGEKKRNEILQLLMIQPKFAILDEIDSGLDIDALQVVAKGVNSMRSPDFGTLMITHYQRLLDYIVPDFVHVMMGGKIVKTGDATLAKTLEAEGYAGLRDDLGLTVTLTDDEN